MAQLGFVLGTLLE